MTTLAIVGGSVATFDGRLEPLDVEIADGRITVLGPPGMIRGAETIDASGCIVAPGFIDVQINGGWGHDFTADPSSFGAVADELPATGVTTFLPTIVTAPPDRREHALDAIAAWTETPGRANAIGLHLEGPAISPQRPGAHDPRWIGRPDRAEIERWTRRNGVALVTLAPEFEGGRELIATLRDQGVVVSIGHTDCTHTQFADARAAGASMVTHLFNAMRAFSHRDPGPIGATLADAEVMAGLICDDVHVDPVVVEMAWRSLGPGRTVLVSDAVAALGATGPDARLGSVAVTVDEHSVRTHDGALAGSILSLDAAIKNLLRCTGCSAADALRTVTANPAHLLGLDDRGRVEIGSRADLVVLDTDLNLQRTIIGGTTAWKS